MMRVAKRFVLVNYQDGRRGGDDLRSGSRDADAGDSVGGACIQLAAIFYIEFDKLTIGRVGHFP